MSHFKIRDLISNTLTVAAVIMLGLILVMDPALIG